MKYVLLVCGAAAALAACNKGPTVNAKNATPEAVAKKVEASGRRQRTWSGRACGSPR